MRIRPIGLVIPALLCVASCAQTTWVKPGATQTDYQVDSYACEKDARQSGYFGGGLAGTINMNDFFSRCMVAHGWSVQAYTNAAAQNMRSNENQADQQAKMNDGISNGEYAEKTELINNECADAVKSPELDIIRAKIELRRNLRDGPPPFSILSNTAYPTAAEKVAIGKWASLRDECNKKMFSHFNKRIMPTAALKNSYEAQISLTSRTLSQVSDITVSLYQGKLTYGDFAKKRMDIGASYMSGLAELQKSTGTAPAMTTQ